MLNAARRFTDQNPISYPRDEEPLDAYSRAVATVVDRVGPAVVRVESVAGGRRRGGGSGVIIAGDGLVLTNSHVVGDAKRVRLAIAEGGEAEAQLLGGDPDTDLALLRSELPSGTPAAALGDFESLAARTARRRDRQPAWLRVHRHSRGSVGARAIYTRGKTDGSLTTSSRPTRRSTPATRADRS